MKAKFIPNFNGVAIIEVFMMELHEYLPPAHYEATISEQQQQEVLDKLKQHTAKAKFSFIIDGLTGKMKHCNGIKKWLGYADEKFSVQQMLEITHPAHIIPHWLNGAAIWNVLSTHTEWVTFYDVSMLYTVGLKHRDGHYVICSCENFFMQVSKDGKGTEFAYEYTVLKKMDLEDFNVSFFDKHGPRNDILEHHREAKKEKFKSLKLFSTQEMRLLHRYAYHAESNTENIAKAFKIDRKTVSTHNTNILDKAQLFFYYRFESAKKFAAYLKRLEII